MSKNKEFWLALGILAGIAGVVLSRTLLQSYPKKVRTVATPGNATLLSRYSKNGKVLVMQSPGEC